MIKPTIGRVMWYWPDHQAPTSQPRAAIVCYVHNDNMVNAVVFDEHGNPEPHTRVPIVQDGSPHRIGMSPYLEWMPYQIGQAKANPTA